MTDKPFTELLTDYIQTHSAECPELLMPRFRIIAADPPYPAGRKDFDFDRLDVKALLVYLFPDKQLHTRSYSASSIGKDLYNTYEDFWLHPTVDFFRSNGTLTRLPLNGLLYYQDEIDLRGRHPNNGGLDEPVLIVEYGDDIRVLYNGYHRACYYLIAGEAEINAYVLKVKPGTHPANV